MAETVSCFFLPQSSSWLHSHTSMAQTQICPSAVFTDTFGFTQAFSSSAQSYGVGPCGAKASTCLSQQPSKCLLAKDTNKGCAVISSSWGDFKKKRQGSSVLLIPLHCFWIYSQDLLGISCSDSGYCFCGIWFYIQGAEQIFCTQATENSSHLYPFLGQNISETQRNGQEQGPDKIIWAISGPWWSVVHPDLAWQHLNLKLQRAKRLYHLSTAIVPQTERRHCPAAI